MSARTSSHKSTGAWLPLSITGAVAAISILMLALAAAPRLAELVELHQVLRVYQDHIRGFLVRTLLGPEAALPWAGGLIDAMALWISLFVTINIFVYVHEGQLLWGHIADNYCSFERRGIRTALCVTPKFLLAFIATPVVLLATSVSSLRSSRTLFTFCYVTLDPIEIVRYLRFVGMAVASIAVVASTISLLWS
jgi:hypothetical protein